MENNPLIRTDPSGHIWETIADIIGIGWSAVDFWNKPSWSNAGYLAWDVGAAFIPFIPGSYVAKGSKIFMNLDKAAAKTLKVAESSKVVNALKNFNSINKKFGNVEVKLDKANMTHILERHTFDYWGGVSKADNTFFDPKMSVSDIKDLINRALNASSDKIKSYKGGSMQWTVELDGVKYQIGLDKYHVGQFHPVVK